MQHVLEEGGVEVVGGAEQPEAIVEEARLLQPDAIVLGFEDRGAHQLRERVRAAAPRAKFIFWLRDETEMQVFDPGSATPRRIRASAPDALLKELVNGRDRGRTRWQRPI
jgi:DNA-binding NarL/FixJ family response regulator